MHSLTTASVDSHLEVKVYFIVLIDHGVLYRLRMSY